MAMGIIAIAVMVAIFGIISVDYKQQRQKKAIAKPLGPHRLKL
jgi:hypothetical protein